MSDFRSKTAIITGAGTGIGAGIAIMLAARGANVVLIGRYEADLHDTAGHITRAGGQAAIAAGNVADAFVAEQAVSLAVKKFGGLHFAVNNAGIDGGTAKLADVTIDDWNNTISINLSGVFYGMKYQIPAILGSGGGAIVNISSVYADRGLAKHGAYTASKHGVHGLTSVAALDYATDPIRINEVQPGVIKTPMLSAGGDLLTQITAQIPVKRIGRPEDIAKTVCFLLSEEASYITGARISVDGGFLI